MTAQERWMLYIKKYGIAGVVVATVPLMTPYLDKYFDNKASIKTKLMVSEIKDDMLSEIQVMFDKQTALAVDSHARTKLTNQQALYLMQTAVGYQSIHKIEWLKQYLIRYNSHEAINQNRYVIERAMRAELTRQSSIYMRRLNEFVHPKLGRLGDFVNSHFPMEDFLNGISAIVFEHACRDDCTTFYDDVMFYMLEMQNSLWYEAERQMNQ